VPIHIDEPLIRTILLDIEGTTTPVGFVYKTLFPYASRRVEFFLRQHFRDPELRSLIAELRAQHQRDERDGTQPPSWHDEAEDAQLHSSVAYVNWLMGRDSKCTPLKTLQGKIWQYGYERVELHGEVYPDVPPALTRWRKQGREISIYSSGSVLAQQLLFRSTAAGDLTEHISKFFDTRVGAKSESESYRKIAVELGRSPQEVLFISDARKEVEAAQGAGMPAILCLREGTVPDGTHQVIHDFDQVLPE